MSLSGILPEIFVPTFEMAVNYVPLPLLTAKSITQISVNEHSDPPNQFSFQVNDPTMELINAQGGIFTEGSRVEISLGYVGNLRKMIIGEVSSLEADFSSSGPATLTVNGFDLLHRLTRGTFYRRFEGPTPNSGIPDSQIVSQIAAEMGLMPSVDTTSARSEPRVQDQTNFDFLDGLAEANGYLLWVDGDTLYFKSVRPSPSSVQLEWGKTLTSFSPRLNTVGQVSSVEVRGWDPAQKQSFSVSVERSGGENLSSTGQQQISQGSGGESGMVITDAPVASADEARTYAEKVLSNQQNELVTGNGTCVGHPDIQVNTKLELSGVGRFSGTYAVNQVTHSLGDSGYQTSFQVKMQS